MGRILRLLAVGALLSLVAAWAQDSPSLGDVARQARQQKQQKEAQAKDGAAKDSNAGAAKDSAKAPRVINNEDLGSHTIVTSTLPSSGPKTKDAAEPEYDPNSPAAKQEQAQQWKEQIQSQKDAIASLEQQIKELGDSIHYAGGNCVAHCVEWNERQKQKQDEVESMKQQLADAQARLADMQEQARKQGFGSTVYDP